MSGVEIGHRRTPVFWLEHVMSHEQSRWRCASPRPFIHHVEPPTCDAHRVFGSKPRRAHRRTHKSDDMVLMKFVSDVGSFYTLRSCDDACFYFLVCCVYFMCSNKQSLRCVELFEEVSKISSIPKCGFPSIQSSHWCMSRVLTSATRPWPLFSLVC